MKRLYSFAPLFVVMALFVGASMLDVGCAPKEPPKESGNKDAAGQDQTPTDTAQPKDQATPDQTPQDDGAPDQTPPKDESKPDQTPPKDESKPDQTPPKDDGAPDQTPQDQGPGDQPPPAGITMSGSVGAPKLTGGIEPLADVDVCVFQQKNIPCVKSDSAGKFSIANVPKNAETGLVFSKADHVPFILTITTEDKDTAIGETLAVTPKATLDGLGLLLGKSPDYSKGLLAGAVDDGSGNGLAGAKVTMDPSSGDGPYYMSSSGIPDKQLTETSDKGQYIWMNVTPGKDVEISVTHATNKNCTSDGWKGAKAGTTRIPVVAGHMVAAGTTCKP